MKKSELIVRISSKLIFARWVGYLDRAYYGFMRSRQECCRLLKIWASSQIGPFHKKAKKLTILCDSKRSNFITDIFELQFDT